MSFRRRVRVALRSVADAVVAVAAGVRGAFVGRAVGATTGADLTEDKTMEMRELKELKALKETPPKPVSSKALWRSICEDGIPPSRVHSVPPDDAHDVIRHAAYDSKRSLRRVLCQDQDTVNRKDSNNQTAIFYSAIQGYYDCTAMLLEYDADLSVENNAGATPLHAASEGGHKHIILLLLGKLRKQQVNKKTENGETSLTLAGVHQHPEVVSVLLENGADVDPRDDKGLTPLICTCALLKTVKGPHNQSALREVVRHLRNFGATDQTTDEDGNTPLHFAARADDTQVVMHLLTTGSNPTERNSRDQTPADSAPEGPTKLILVAFQGPYTVQERLQGYQGGLPLCPRVQRACGYIRPSEGIELETNYHRKHKRASELFSTNETVKLSIKDHASDTEAAVTLASSPYFPQVTPASSDSPISPVFTVPNILIDDPCSQASVYIPVLCSKYVNLETPATLQIPHDVIPKEAERNDSFTIKVMKQKATVSTTATEAGNPLVDWEEIEATDVIVNAKSIVVHLHKLEIAALYVAFVSSNAEDSLDRIITQNVSIWVFGQHLRTNKWIVDVALCTNAFIPNEPQQDMYSLLDYKEPLEVWKGSQPVSIPRNSDPITVTVTAMFPDEHKWSFNPSEQVLRRQALRTSVGYASSFHSSSCKLTNNDSSITNSTVCLCRISMDTKSHEEMLSTIWFKTPAPADSSLTVSTVDNESQAGLEDSHVDLGRFIGCVCRHGMSHWFNMGIALEMTIPEIRAITYDKSEDFDKLQAIIERQRVNLALSNEKFKQRLLMACSEISTPVDEATMEELEQSEMPNSVDADKSYTNDPERIALLDITVPPEGGCFRSGSLAVSFPPGCLPESKNVQVQLYIGPKLFPAVDESSDEYVVSPVLVLEPHGLTFGKPIEVHFPFSVNPKGWHLSLMRAMCDVSADPQTWEPIVTYDTQTDHLEVIGCNYDLMSGTLSITHFCRHYWLGRAYNKWVASKNMHFCAFGCPTNLSGNNWNINIHCHDICEEVYEKLTEKEFAKHPKGQLLCLPVEMTVGLQGDIQFTADRGDWKAGARPKPVTADKVWKIGSCVDIPVTITVKHDSHDGDCANICCVDVHQGANCVELIMSPALSNKELKWIPPINQHPVTGSAVVQAVLFHGSSRWYTLGLELGFSDDQILSCCDNKPNHGDKLLALLKRMASSVDIRTLEDCLLEACKKIQDPIIANVEEELMLINLFASRD